MRLTLDLLERKFAEYNALIFNNELPPIQLEISNAKSNFGLFCYPREFFDGMPRDGRDCKLKISARYEDDENEVFDTIIHEMIHYYIWIKALKDSSPHGRVFRAIMADINARFNRNITISGKVDDAMRDTDITPETVYLCVLEYADGKLGLLACPQTLVFEAAEKFRNMTGVRRQDWRLGNDPWFNRFKRSRKLEPAPISREDFKKHVENLLQLEFYGNWLLPREAESRRRPKSRPPQTR